MSPEAIVAVIAILGVILSVFASFFICKQNIRTELQKMQKEIQMRYAEKILEKRLESYPALYRLLSNLSKKNESKNSMTARELEEFRKQVNDWDSSYSIFLSAGTGKSCYKFRQVLRRMCKKNDAEIGEQIQSRQSEIWSALVELEVALKNDIGVYAVDFSMDKSQIPLGKEMSPLLEEE